MPPFIPLLIFSFCFALFSHLSANEFDGSASEFKKLSLSKPANDIPLSQYDISPTGIASVDVSAPTKNVAKEIVSNPKALQPIEVTFADAFKKKIFLIDAENELSLSVVTRYSAIFTPPISEQDRLTKEWYLNTFESFFKPYKKLDNVDRIEIIEILTRTTSTKFCDIMNCVSWCFGKEMNGDNGKEIIEDLAALPDEQLHTSLTHFLPDPLAYQQLSQMDWMQRLNWLHQRDRWVAPVKTPANPKVKSKEN